MGPVIGDFSPTRVLASCFSLHSRLCREGSRQAPQGLGRLGCRTSRERSRGCRKKGGRGVCGGSSAESVCPPVNREQKSADCSRSETGCRQRTAADSTNCSLEQNRKMTQGERGSRDKPRLCGRLPNLINSLGGQRLREGAGTSWLPPIPHLIKSFPLPLMIWISFY